MIPQLKRQADLTGVAAGGVSTMMLPAAGVHHGLHLVVRSAAGVGLTRAQMITDIGSIVLRLNGDRKIDVTMTALLDIWKYYFDQYVVHTVAGAIPIPFVRPSYPLMETREAMAWGMADVQSYTLEVTWNAGLATAASCEVYCEIEDRTAPLGRHLCIETHPQNFGSTGDQDVTTLPFADPSMGYIALHFTNGSGQIDALTVNVNNNDAIDEIPSELNAHLLKQAGRNAQSGYYHADFCRINHPGGFLPCNGMSNFRQRVNWNAAAGAPGNYSIIAEVLRGLDKAVA